METIEDKPRQRDKQVYLRSDTVSLRCIFNYHTATQPSGWMPSISSTWSRRRPLTHFSEAKLVALDVDELREVDGMPQQFHLGISILTTRDLHDQCHLLQSTSPTIRSHHWVVGDEQYFQNHDTRYRFGKARCVPLSALSDRLQNLLRDPCPVVLVVHGGHREITLLHQLGIDLDQKLVIDTTKAARYPLQAFSDYRLRHLLDEFEIPYVPESLHVAGNDAHFTLRALLMIAVKDVQRGTEQGQLPPWVPVFEAIARSPIPPAPLKKGQKAAIKRRERREAEDDKASYATG